MKMICFCGHDCSRCLTYHATVNNDEDLRKKSQSFYRAEFGLDIALKDIYCFGGRSDNVFRLCKECPFKKCCFVHNVERCSLCVNYPCDMIRDYQDKYVNKCNLIE